jgi:two-component system, chemotaxis family, protein-glutamate methylesterase/glutaminase
MTHLGRLRVLVAEPSWEHTLRDVFTEEPTTDLIGVACDGLQTVALTLALEPDVVVMETRLPRIDGFEATRRIMIERPTPIVMVTGSAGGDELRISSEAQRAGALATVRRPSRPRGFDGETPAAALIKAVHAMARIKLVRRWPDAANSAARASSPSTQFIPPSRTRVVAIGASTGGPAALYRLFSALSPRFGLPILVTQHIAPGFVEGMASWLDGAGHIKVKVAEDGDRLQPDTAYLAGDDTHLTLRDVATIALSNSGRENGLRPSASVMFRSVAEKFGPAGLAVVLTGMGRDGIDGLRPLHSRGGIVLAQDETSSTVFGMPKAAIEAGIADAILPLEAIAPQLRLMTSSAEGCG